MNAAMHTEVVRLFQAAFPDAPRRKIAKDVGRLIESLEDRGLIARAGSARNRKGQQCVSEKVP